MIRHPPVADDLLIASLLRPGVHAMGRFKNRTEPHGKEIVSDGGQLLNSPVAVAAREALYASWLTHGFVDRAALPRIVHLSQRKKGRHLIA